VTVNRQGFQRLAGPKTFAALVEHYRSKELPTENHERKTRKTKKNYEGGLKNHILPRWGEYQLRDVCSVDVEEWLGLVDLAPSSKAKLRNIMSTVFRHGIRWGWLGQQENPITMVRVSSKRLRTPETLTAKEFIRPFRETPGPGTGDGRALRDDRTSDQRDAWAEVGGHRFRDGAGERAPFRGRRRRGTLQDGSLAAARPPG